VKDKKSIFICVDDPLFQYTLATILEREGYQIVSQSLSQLADFRVIDEPVNLLILDNNERWDELWNQQLNKIRCQFAKQPILILTAHLPGAPTFDCEDFGFCKIIQKPTDPVVILEKARELLI
jgi:DNA-binding response OmpR family regulator